MDGTQDVPIPKKATFLVLKYKAVLAGEEGEEDPNRILDQVIFCYPPKWDHDEIAKLVGVLIGFTTFSRLNIGGMITSFVWDRSVIAVKSIKLSDGNFLIYSLMITPSSNSLFRFTTSSIHFRLDLILQTFALFNPIFFKPGLTPDDVEQIRNFLNPTISFTFIPKKKYIEIQQDPIDTEEARSKDALINSILNYYLGNQNTPHTEEDFINFSTFVIPRFSYKPSIPTTTFLFSSISKYPGYVATAFYWYEEDQAFENNPFYHFELINSTFSNTFNRILPFFFPVSQDTANPSQKNFPHFVRHPIFSSNSFILNSDPTKNTTDTTIKQFTLGTYGWPCCTSSSELSSIRCGLYFALALDSTDDSVISSTFQSVENLLMHDIEQFAFDCLSSSKSIQPGPDNVIVYYPQISLMKGHLQAEPPEIKAGKPLYPPRLADISEQMEHNRMIHELVTFDEKVASCGFKFPRSYIFTQISNVPAEKQVTAETKLKKMMSELYNSATNSEILPFDHLSEK